MDCPRCGYALSEVDETCPRCARGRPQRTKQCPICGAVSQAGSKVCDGCGYRFSVRDIPLPNQRLASCWRRLSAHVIDGIILLFIFWFLVGYPQSQVPLELKERSLLWRPWFPYLAWLAMYVLYHGLFIGLRAATPGKKLFRLQVCRTTAGPCGVPRALLRAAAQVATPAAGFVAYPIAQRLAEGLKEILASRMSVEAASWSLWLGSLLFLWMLHDRHRRGLHDHIAGTIVVLTRVR